MATHKIIFLFCCLFFCVFQVNANENQKMPKIRFQVESQILDTLLFQLERQSGYKFIYTDKRWQGEGMYFTGPALRNLEEGKTVSELIDILLAETGYGYVVIGRRNKSVVLYKQKSAPFSVTGIVIDEKGEAIQSALVYVKGEDNKMMFTDENGKFTITTTNPNAYVIVSYSAFYSPRVVHIRDAEEIKPEPDDEMCNTIFRVGGL